jgi:hypothetical protein
MCIHPSSFLLARLPRSARRFLRHYPSLSTSPLPVTQRGIGDSPGHWAESLCSTPHMRLRVAPLLSPVYPPERLPLRGLHLNYYMSQIYAGVDSTKEFCGTVLFWCEGNHLAPLSETFLAPQHAEFTGARVLLKKSLHFRLVLCYDEAIVVRLSSPEERGPGSLRK